MFDFLTTNPAIALLKKDHDKVKALFDQFEKAKGRTAKKKIVEAALLELKVHAAIEEELFYPAVRKQLGKKMMNEADEEHHVAKVLIAELAEMDGSESHYDAKFTVLAENVRHHIKEEENDMFPEAKDVKIDFDQLGLAMQARKEKLMSEGVAPVAEDKMVASSRRNGDSSAKAAQKKSRAKPKRD